MKEVALKSAKSSLQPKPHFLCLFQKADFYDFKDSSSVEFRKYGKRASVAPIFEGFKFFRKMQKFTTFVIKQIEANGLK